MALGRRRALGRQHPVPAAGAGAASLPPELDLTQPSAITHYVYPEDTSTARISIWIQTAETSSEETG